jgi:hypothetical protein
VADTRIFQRIGAADAPAVLNALTSPGPGEYGAAPLACAPAFTDSGPELDVTATAGYRGQGCEPVGWPAICHATPAPERMFCERGLTDAYCFSRHSYSAGIRNSTGPHSDHAQRLPLVGRHRVLSADLNSEQVCRRAWNRRT